MAKTVSMAELQKIFKKDLPRALDFAKVETLNILAGKTRKEVIRDVRGEFTLRNNYTIGSIRFEKATKSSKQSITFTTAEYMGYHETGETLSRNLWGQSMNVNPMGTIYSRGNSTLSKIKDKYRFNKMGKIATSKNRTSTNGFFMLKTKEGSPAIYKRTEWGKGVGKGGIVAIKVLKKSEHIEEKAFFDKASDEVLKSSDAFKGYSKMMNIYLP